MPGLRVTAKRHRKDRIQSPGRTSRRKYGSDRAARPPETARTVQFLRAMISGVLPHRDDYHGARRMSLGRPLLLLGLPGQPLAQSIERIHDGPTDADMRNGPVMRPGP